MKLTAFTKAMPVVWLHKRYPKMSSRPARQNGSLKRQIVMTIKLTTVLMITVLMQVSAKGFGQKISLNVTNLPLEKVLRRIESQSGFVFFFDDKLGKQNVSVTVNNVVISDALDACFKGSILTYQIADKTIFIRKKKESAAAGTANITIRGAVMDTAGISIPGAVVRIKNSKLSVLTDDRGEFELNAPDNSVLVVSSIGYESREVTFSSNGRLKIVLSQSVSKLDEIQIVAYGTTTSRLSTGSISKVAGKDIASNPGSNPLLGLSGRVAGVNITEGSSVAGSAINISIRGQNSIYAGQLPLYVVDGVPFDGKAVEQPTGGTYVILPSIVGNTGFNPLNVLNPSMIESIEILKDADATALYGSRAANGVVIITTKKGKAGNVKVDASLFSGISTISRTLPMLNAAQYTEMRQKAFANDGITPTATNAPDLVSFTPGWDTNYQKYFFNQGHFTNGDVSVSGGSEQTQFLINANYRFESPVFTGDFADKVSHVKLSLQHSSKDKRFKLSASGNYSTDNNALPTFNLYSIYNLAPTLPLYNAAGNLAWYTGYSNPVATLLNHVNQKNNDLLGNLSMSYQIIDGLTFKTDAGYHKTDIENTLATMIAAKNPALAATTLGNVNRTMVTNELYNIEPQLNYSRQIAKGKLQALVGGTYQYSSTNQPLYYAGTFTSDALYQDIGSTTITSKSSYSSERKYLSVFGRLNYVWENKYIINGNFRRDGSTNFSPGNRYGNFGSIGGAWIVSEEHFLKDNLSWLSYLKLRTSYGSVGNDQISPYTYLSYYASSSTYAGAATLNPVRLANTNNYSWETTKKFDASADLGFLKDRILLTVNWYRNETSNILFNLVPIAAQTGFSGYVGNIPGLKVENKGWEFEVNTTNIQSKAFTWKTSINFTASKNKLLSFPDLASSVYSTGSTNRLGTSPGYIIGAPINSLFGYELTSMTNGVATVKDQNGDGVITPGLLANGKGDYVYLGTSDPKFYGGISNSFTYKQFQLDVLIQFVKKKNFNIYHGSTVAPGGNANQPADILNQPFVYSATTSSAAYTSYVRYYALSDATISDASYIRLKNVSLTYNLPQHWINKLGMQRAGVFFRAQNLFTITNYLGYDPDSFGQNMPLSKMATIGFQTSF